VQSLSRKSLIFFPSDDAYFLGVRTKNADREIIANSMRPKNPKRIGMRPGEKSIELIYGQTGYFERAHARTAILKPLGKMSCVDFVRIQKSDGYL
jgi:hypothetical protein